MLTNASVEGKVDKLVGLKENVIIGKLIPARAEIEVPPREHIPELDLPESLLLEEEAELERMLAEREGDGAAAAGGAATAVLVDGEEEASLGKLSTEDEIDDFQIPDGS